jgi:hypothetical protein
VIQLNFLDAKKFDASSYCSITKMTPRGVWSLILPLFKIILLYIIVPLFQQNIFMAEKFNFIYGGKIQFHLWRENSISFMVGNWDVIYGGKTDVYLWRENGRIFMAGKRTYIYGGKTEISTPATARNARTPRHRLVTSHSVLCSQRHACKH